MAKGREKDYFCDLVSEDVVITLKIRPSLSLESKGEMFVKCNQSECQYIDNNQYPCPLCLDLFADEIEKREEKARKRNLNYYNSGEQSLSSDS